MSLTEDASDWRNALLQSYRDCSLHDLPLPAAVIDIGKVKANCTAMLNAVNELDVSFRAHVKTHKTAEITRLQVGVDCKDVRLVVSTVLEAEHLLPLLLDYKSQGAKVNVLYGIPLGPSQVGRLASVGAKLGPGSVSVMIDHIDQLKSLTKFKEEAGYSAFVFIKTDSGYHRAGLAPDSGEMISLIEAINTAEQQGILTLLGFYSHNSLSYGGNSPDDAMDMLKLEIDECWRASQHLTQNRQRRLLISVGASPSALSIQNILPSAPTSTPSAASLQDTLQLVQSNFELEIHAGVYPIFDLQQVAASSRHFETDPHDNIAVSILAEVCSLYPERTERPEALISAGCLALAREPCKGYSGWGVLSPWNVSKDYSITKEHRIIVTRISQEHGILAYEDPDSQERQIPLEVGQKVRIWPNHACITLASFEYYFIVDSSSKSPDRIVDVMVRCRGW